MSTDDGDRAPVASDSAAVDGPTDLVNPFVAGEGAPSGDLEVGWTLDGPYRLLRELGSGGMGTVYLAERADGEPGVVAVKIMAPMRDAEHGERRFRREWRTLRAMSHPGIATYLDGGRTSDGRPYFVMQHVDGIPVDQHCDARGLGIEDRIELFRKVCSAVAYVNRHAIIHRDLKPSNILVTRDGEPKLLDFGIARYLNPTLAGEANPPTRGASMMTYRYASPEQVQDHPLDTSSDVYALGVLLYELLVGESPYEHVRSGDAALLREIVEAEPPRPSTAVRRVTVGGADGTGGPGRSTTRSGGTTTGRRSRGRLPADLDRIILRALRKEPQRRYGTATELADDLGRFLRGLPVLAGGDTVGYRMSKFVRRNRVPVAAGVMVAISVSAALVATSRGWSQERDARATADARAQRLATLATRYLDGIDRAVADLDGGTRIRSEFAQLGVDILEESVADLDASEQRTGRLLLARGYARLGSVAGGVRNPSEGDRRKAAEAYALARDAAEELLEAHPGDQEIESVLAGVLTREADLLRRAEDWAQVRPRLERVYGIRERHYEAEPTTEHERGLALVLLDLGRLERKTGNSAAAMPFVRESLRLRRNLLDASPGDPSAQRGVALALNRLAVLHEDLGEFDAASARYQEALVLRRDNFAADPGSARYRRDLNLQIGLSVEFDRARGAFESAANGLAPVLETVRETARRNPGEWRAQKDLADFEALAGWIAVERARWEDARRHFDAGLEAATKARDRTPDDGAVLARIADVRTGLARLSVQAGDPEAALRHLDAARSIHEATGDGARADAVRAIALAAAGRGDEAADAARRARTSLAESATADSDARVRVMLEWIEGLGLDGSAR